MLIDQFGRTVDYLRISVTESCNFRCQYCMPETPENKMKQEQLLTTDELSRFIRIGISEGIRKIRLTGGEPLLRDDLPEIIRRIKEQDPSVSITLTTNAFQLEEKAQALRDAGLERINISLDSIRPETFRLITKTGDLDTVLRGIAKAREIGLGVKINMVPLKNINEQEIVPMMEYCQNHHMRLRFIEYMENTHAFGELQGLRSEEILETVGQQYDFHPIDEVHFGPAKLYQTTDGYKFGIIQPHSDSFCQDCNRIRLSSDGKLIPCLYFEDAIDMKQALKDGSDEDVLALIAQVLATKPEKNKWSGELAETSSRAFYQTGG